VRVPIPRENIVARCAFQCIFDDASCPLCAVYSRHAYIPRIFISILTHAFKYILPHAGKYTIFYSIFLMHPKEYMCILKYI
jgi:disulfide bond formation protein DsbB